MTGFPAEVVAAAFDVAALPPGPFALDDRVRRGCLEIAPRREAEELRLAADACEATDPARAQLLREDRTHVLARLDSRVVAVAGEGWAA